MSGVTSTIHDSGRVYLFDRNALPKNFIEAGMKMTPSGLAVNVLYGTCDIGGKFHKLDAQASIALTQRMACLVYALKSDLTDTPTFGYIPAAFPAADAGTVCRYIIDGSVSIASTGGSGGGVLTRNGGIAQTDGWIGCAGKGDGSTGYYVSANSTGFPSGANPVEVDVLYTHATPTGAATCIFGYGTSGNYPALYSDASDNLYVFTTGAANTGYVLERGRTHHLVFAYDGAAVKVYVNGALVYVAAVTLNVTPSALYVFRTPSISNYNAGTIHYVELRNALRTPAQIAAISNALLLPCRYDQTAAAVDRAAGTVISDFNLRASNAFDGNTAQLGNGGTAATRTASTSGYIGKDWGADAKRKIVSVDIYPTTDSGFFYSSFTSILFEIKAGAAVGSLTAIASATITSDQTMPLHIDVTGFNTHHQCHAVSITVNGASADSLYIGEVVFNEESISTTDIRSILPADSISLGFVRTDATKVIEANDTDYKFWRREGAVGGNRKVFLGWKYFGSGGVHLDWAINPLGTRMSLTRYFYAEDATGGNMVECQPIFSASGSSTEYYGIQRAATSNSPFRVYIGNSGAVQLNGMFKTSGYIGCYAEVIE